MLTAVATGVAVAAAAAQYTIPAMIPALQRTPGGGLPDGQWWRLVTPLLVQTLGWYQVAANLGTLPIIGAVTERLLGRGWWLALAAAGTAGGELAAYHWRDPGGGDSIAICGLAAGVIVILLVRPATGTSRQPPVRMLRAAACPGSIRPSCWCRRRTSRCGSALSLAWSR